MTGRYDLINRTLCQSADEVTRRVENATGLLDANWLYLPLWLIKQAHLWRRGHRHKDIGEIPLESLPVDERIVEDPRIMVGKPVVRGTRIPVERVIAHLSRTPDLDDLFAAYPELTVEDVQAVLRFAYAAVLEMMVPKFPVNPSRLAATSR